MLKKGLSAFIAVLTAAQILGSPAPASAQSPSLKLTLIATPVRPKTAAYINASLTNLTDTPAFELRESLRFPKEYLNFVSARLGIAGDLAGATLTVETQDDSGARVDRLAATRLAITVTAQKPLAAGPLVEFQFQVVDAEERTIRLAHTAEVRDKAGNGLPGLAFEDVDVIVSHDLAPAPMSVFSCFFYMH